MCRDRQTDMSTAMYTHHITTALCTNCRSNLMQYYIYITTTAYRDNMQCVAHWSSGILLYSSRPGC